MQSVDNKVICNLKQSHLSVFPISQAFPSGYGCQMTMIAQLYTKILLSVPLFSLIYYLLSWAFIALFVAFLIYHAFYKRTYQSSSLQGYSSLGQDEEDEQDEDLQMFIKRNMIPEDQDALKNKIKSDKAAERMEKYCWDN